MRRRQVRWSSRLASFVSDRTVTGLSQDLGVTRWAIYSWISGRSEPRLSTARRLVELSSGALSLEDVVRHRQEVGDGADGQPGPERAPGAPAGSLLR